MNRRSFLVGATAAAASVALPSLAELVAPILELPDARPVMTYVGAFDIPPYPARVGDVYFNMVDNSLWSCTSDKVPAEDLPAMAKGEVVKYARTWMRVEDGWPLICAK